MNTPKTIDTKRFKVKKGLNGLGLFAQDTIKNKEWIIEYIGTKLTAKQSENVVKQYLFEVHKNLTLDGSIRTNTARYINYSCEPNAEAWNVNDRIFIRAIRDIAKDEEITYDYGIEFFDMFIKGGKKGCYCGSKKCKYPKK
jgi:SET domain-containing protein